MSSCVYRKVNSSRKREAYLMGVCWCTQQRWAWAQVVRLVRLLLEWVGAGHKSVWSGGLAMVVGCATYYEGDGFGVDVFEESGAGHPEGHTSLLTIVNIRIVCEMGVTQRGVM